jgi:hypothetical protein
MPLTRELRLKVTALTAYSLNGLGRYEDAIEELCELRRLDSEKAGEFWPALAYSYAHFKLDQRAEFLAWLNKATNHPGTSEYLEAAVKIYPELKEDLLRCFASSGESSG